jgi:hypothetical protein
VTAFHVTIRDRETQMSSATLNGSWTTDQSRALTLRKREAAEAHAARMRDHCPNKKQGASRWQTIVNASPAKSRGPSLGGVDESRLSPGQRPAYGFIQGGSAAPARWPTRNADLIKVEEITTAD